MELLCELLLTAAVTLLAAFLLATLFAANDPRRETDRAGAAAIVEEAAAEERIIEVDEVKLNEGRAAAVEPEEWVEVEKAPALVVEEKPGFFPEEEEGIPMKAGRAVRVSAVLEEEQEVDVEEKRRDLTAAAPAATEVAAEANPHVLGAETVPREVVDTVTSEKGMLHDAGVKQPDLGTEVAPTEVIDLLSAEQRVQAVQVAEVVPSKTQEVEVKQHPLVSAVVAAEVRDAGLDKSAQAVEVRPDALVAETVPEEVLDVVLEKKEEQLSESEEQGLVLEAAPQPIIVPLTEREELQHQPPVGDSFDVHEEVQNKQEAKIEVHQVDQQEELVPAEELLTRKTDDIEVTGEDRSNDAGIELPAEEVTLQGLPEDTAADIDFGDWEGIERSEVEKRFGAAAAFAASEAGVAALSKLNSDVQLQLQGLLKVAIDGPCYDSTQPLTLRPSSRAKWAAWQKLGNMHPEIAMEKYMNLLSETIPGWQGNETLGTEKQEPGCYAEGPMSTMITATNQLSIPRNEYSASIDGGPRVTSPNPEKGQSSDIPAE